MRKSVVTRVLLVTALGSVGLTAFRAPLSSTEVALQNRQLDHEVIGKAIESMFTGQAALRGIVVAEMTIDPMLDEQLNDRNSDLLKTQFPQHVQIVPLTAKDFAKPKKPMKFDRVLLEAPKNKINFEKMEELAKMGLSFEALTDSSWRVFKAKYPDATNFIAFSLPGYDSGRDMALVSYFNLCGPSCYQKGYVLLERNENTRMWRMLHRNVVFGGG